jgi:hypothetical protein
MQNITNKIHSSDFPGFTNTSRLHSLLPPGWGIKQSPFTRGFTKAFVCFGGSFVSLHSTTQQLIRNIHEKNAR